MKLLSYTDSGREGIGALSGDSHFVDFTRLKIADDMNSLIENLARVREQIEIALKSKRDERALTEVKIVAPIPVPRRNIFCVGKNYSAHAKEFGRSGFDGGATGGEEIPEYPIIFSKPASCVIGPDEGILSKLDPYQSVDYEGELAVIIGRNGRVGPDEDPMSFVFGYTIFNDVTSRELQKRHKQWLLGKGIDTFGPMGPWIVTEDEFAKRPLAETYLSTFVNSERRQYAPLSDLIFDVPTLVATVGRSISLQAGDIIATGTPLGVGIGFKPPRYLKAGDTVRVEITGIGHLSNQVA